MTLAKKACKDYRIPLLAVLIFVIMSLVNKNFFGQLFLRHAKS